MADVQQQLAAPGSLLPGLVGSRGEARASRDTGCSSTAVAETTCKPHEAFRRRRPEGRRGGWERDRGLSGSSQGVAHPGLLVGTMATSSGDDVPTQLAALLGYTIKRLRITDEVPPRISVIDLATAITMKGANQAAEQVSYVKKRHPEVTEIFGGFKFRGQGQSGPS